jgi:tripartite-type tricarboxylate transporter receptor subunit TctC
VLLGSAQFLLVVHPSVQASAVPELVGLLKKSRPGEFTYSSAGIGSPNHLAAELFKGRAGVDMVHVPYKGGGPAAVAAISGEVKLLFASFASSLVHVKSGRLRALAVTGPKRSSEMPDIPTMQELGFTGFDVRAWYGLLAPARTPKAIVSRLNEECLKILAMPDVRNALKREGLEPSGSTPEEFVRHIRDEKALWARVIKDAGIRPE